MKSNKVIIVNGLQRGGTNIAWNIIQSHPSVVSALRETGKILYQSKTSSYAWAVIRSNKLIMKLTAQMAGGKIDQLFQDYKMKSLEHEDDRYMYEGILYKPQEIQDSILCLKTVNQDVQLTEFFSTLYPNCHFVGVIRNGYAMCESWVRRGYSAKTAGIAYRKYVRKMLEDKESYKNYEIIRFENILKDPFGSATKLYTALGLTPNEIPKLRFKSKKVLLESGNHVPAFGEEEHKYWFSKDTIGEIIKSNIDDIQCSKLSNSDRKAFYKEAYVEMNTLGYE